MRDIPPLSSPRWEFVKNKSSTVDLQVRTTGRREHLTAQVGDIFEIHVDPKSCPLSPSAVTRFNQKGKYCEAVVDSLISNTAFLAQDREAFAAVEDTETNRYYMTYSRYLDYGTTTLILRRIMLRGPGVQSK